MDIFYCNVKEKVFILTRNNQYWKTQQDREKIKLLFKLFKCHRKAVATGRYQHKEITAAPAA